MKTYKIEYRIGKQTCSYKVRASSKAQALKFFRNTMAHPPVTPSGALMWSPTFIFAENYKPSQVQQIQQLAA